MAAADKAGLPGAVLKQVRTGVAGPEDDGARRRVAHGGRVGEDLGHAGVRREGLALLDADGGQQAQELRVQGIDGLLLDHRVDLLIERDVVGVDGVEGTTREVDELRGGRIITLRQGVNPRVCLEVGHRRLRVAVLEEAAPDQPVAEGARGEGVVALGHLALVARRQDQELAALPPVGAGVAQVGHVAEEEIVEDAQGVGRALHHHRPVLQVQPGHRVDALGVGGQEQRPGVHQVFEDADRAVDGADFTEALAHGVQRGDRQAVEKGAHAALEIEVVVHRLDSLGARKSVEKRQRPQAGLDALGGQDRGRDRFVLDRLVLDRRGLLGASAQQHRQAQCQDGTQHGFVSLFNSCPAKDRVSRRHKYTDKKRAAGVLFFHSQPPEIVARAAAIYGDSRAELTYAPAPAM